MTLVQVRLARDCMQTPWGFRLQGGKDLNQQLTVQRVFANTPSERELHRGDVIVAINGRDTSNLTHKQAQDAISGGGGQIEFLVQRPTGAVNIKPLTPAPDTRAPTFPQSPTRAPQINIPIQKKSGPPSPGRVIPISPQKPTPPSKPAKPTQQGTDTTDMSAGFIPTKITMNKYGGGGPNYGSQFGGPSSPQHRAQPAQYRPVAAPVPAQQYQPPQQTQTQFSAPQASGQEERGVEEEQYGGVSERRRQFLKGPAQQPKKNFKTEIKIEMHKPVAPQPEDALGSDEDDYPTAPVWERRKLFGNKKRVPPPAIQRSRKPVPTFGRARQTAESTYMNFGVDYAKPQVQPQTHAKKPASRPRPPPVNRRDDDELDSQPWSNTLKGESQLLKPWEREALEAERYQSGTVDQPYRPHTQQPPTAPKPKITQISAQSTARPAESQLSPSAGYSTQPKKPAAPGERDWNDSYVYQMIHSTEKTTTSSRQDAPGQSPHGESVTTTRVTHESKIPGQEPQRTVTETVQRGGVPDYKFDSAIGLSDF